MITPIKDVMTRHGLTVADLALISGKSTRMIEYWRNGKWQAPRYVMIILAALDDGRIDIDWLIAKLKV